MFYLNEMNRTICVWIFQENFSFRNDIFPNPHTGDKDTRRWNMLAEEMSVTALFIVSLTIRNIATQECGINSYSIYQMMLKGHTFQTFNARPGSLDCRQACNSDVRCQSYNYVIFKDICELNNRTKEARPQDFVRDKDRYYMTKAPKRGSQIKETIT